jgi:hypothetical protein
MSESGGQNPHYGEETEQEPQYGDGSEGDTGAAPDGDGDAGIDTSTQNDDLHGQAQEVAESASEPGAAETPAG